MAKVKLLNYSEASSDAKIIFEDIMKTRKTSSVNNIWRALANHPPLLKRFWEQMKAVMIKPSRLDNLTKELIYLAVSITNNCEYCINSHIESARNQGMDDEILCELNEIIGLANQGNRLTQGLQVDIDKRFQEDFYEEKWMIPDSVRAAEKG